MKTWSQRARGLAPLPSPDGTAPVSWVCFKWSVSSNGVATRESCLSPLRSEVAVSNGRNDRGLFDLDTGEGVKNNYTC